MTTSRTGKKEQRRKKIWITVKVLLEDLKIFIPILSQGTNLFKSIREIKKENGLMQDKLQNLNSKILNNNYFHHLNQFYQMLDLIKNFLEQEYSHNLEKREHIIARAKIGEQTGNPKALKRIIIPRINFGRKKPE